MENASSLFCIYGLGESEIKGKRERPTKKNEPQKSGSPAGRR